jgi:hypothetical protein
MPNGATAPAMVKLGDIQQLATPANLNLQTIYSITGLYDFVFF